MKQHAFIFQVHFPPFKNVQTFKILGGWSWFTWTPKITDYVFSYLENHPEYLKRFNHTYCGDELFFSTILHPVAEKIGLDEKRPLRYVSWEQNRRKSDVGKYHPYILNEEDFEDIRDNGTLFCKKVQLPVSRKLLDLIDKNK